LLSLHRTKVRLDKFYLRALTETLNKKQLPTVPLNFFVRYLEIS